MAVNNQPVQYQLTLAYAPPEGGFNFGGEGGNWSVTNSYGLTDETMLALYTALLTVPLPAGYTVNLSRTEISIDTQTANDASGSAAFQE